MEEFKKMVKGDVVNDYYEGVKGLLVYCDFIADLIKTTLPGAASGNIKCGTVQSYLHPEHGYLVSSKKVIDAEYLGKHYKITVEEA